MTIFDSIKTLPAKDKAAILDELLKDLTEKNRYGHGTIWGTNQIIDRMEEYAIRLGCFECPLCHRKGG